MPWIGRLPIRFCVSATTNEPVIAVKHGKFGRAFANEYCNEVWIEGPCKVIYGGNDKPLLSCGARVVVETESELRIGIDKEVK